MASMARPLVEKKKVKALHTFVIFRSNDVVFYSFYALLGTRKPICRRVEKRKSIASDGWASRCDDIQSASSYPNALRGMCAWLKYVSAALRSTIMCVCVRANPCTSTTCKHTATIHSVAIVRIYQCDNSYPKQINCHEMRVEKFVRFSFDFHLIVSPLSVLNMLPFHLFLFHLLIFFSFIRSFVCIATSRVTRARSDAIISVRLFFRLLALDYFFLVVIFTRKDYSSSPRNEKILVIFARFPNECASKCYSANNKSDWAWNSLFIVCHLKMSFSFSRSRARSRWPSIRACVWVCVNEANKSPELRCEESG